MNVLDELTRLRPDTSGPDVAATTAARAALETEVHTTRRGARWSRRRRIITIATAVAVAGASAAAAAIRSRRSSLEFAEYRTSTRLPDAKVLEVWAAPRANGVWNCPYLRIAPLAKRGDGEICGLVLAADYDPDALSVQRQRLDAYRLVALYGHAPSRASSVTIEFGDGRSTIVPVRRGWFVTTAPDAANPIRVVARSGDVDHEAMIPAPLPVVDGPQGPTCSVQGTTTDRRPVPVRIPKPSKYPGTAKYADAKLIMQGRPLPGAAWAVLLMRDRGNAFLRLDHTAEEGQAGGASGGSFDPSAGRLGASASSFTNDASILLGAATARTTCVVATDSLGRTTATTRLVRDRRFPTLRFWVLVVPNNATVRKIEALDSRGRRIDQTHFEGLTGRNTP